MIDAAPHPAEAIIERLPSASLAFSGDMPAEDDVTLVVIKREN